MAEIRQSHVERNDSQMEGNSMRFEKCSGLIAAAALAAALGSNGQTPGAVRQSLVDWIRRTQPGLTP